MKIDLEIKNNILEELIWQPILRKAEIGVEVKNRIVTLTGIVSNLAEKIMTINAAKKVKGVKAVVDGIEVKCRANFNDTDIAKKILFDLEWNTSVPQEKISVKVKDGYVFLSGTVKWAYQKREAIESLEYIDGIKSITNDIIINDEEIPINIEQKIKKAFERSADIDANNITVKIDGHTVTLTGKVHSLKEKEDARRTAFYAPGVWNVENELEVEY
ncbi:BON domain-containing protein [Lacinutrix sp. WUR7]|uniref:BON domain-containing protein n=1 Tax=Lacinutrix sp. WUR7 TaxID=2653681 RepID=UPI00193DA146|nr:BON domain-containing protein [Lacinutrix sp. WUR7]QRM90819.1 BON domain-containing protein [Lacinutrix sp. WUR7]